MSPAAPERPRRRLSLPIAFTCCVLAAGCGSQAQEPARAAADAPMPVTAIRAAAARVPVTLEAVGQAEGSREVEIRARVGGILEKRLFEEGSRVAAGKVLFLIDAAPYELAVQQAQAALLQEQVRRELAEREAARLAPLAKDRAIPQREVDQAVATARQATAAIAAAEARLRVAELNLSYTRLAAPIGGITGRALRSEGSLVAPDSDAGLLTTLTQVDPIWVRFALAEPDFARLRGHERDARVELVGRDGAVAAAGGRLNFTASTVDARMGTVQLRAEFANAERRWLPGQFVKVRVVAGEQQAILVPQVALSQTGESRMVMTVGADGKVVPKAVTTQGWHGADAVVTAGLAQGELVIVDNLVKLRPGMAVAPRVPAAAPAKAQ